MLQLWRRWRKTHGLGHHCNVVQRLGNVLENSLTVLFLLYGDTVRSDYATEPDTKLDRALRP
jgi:hypothetical protein